MLFQFITDNEYEKLTNPDAVKKDMSNHLDGLCKSGILYNLGAKKTPDFNRGMNSRKP